MEISKYTFAMSAVMVQTKMMCEKFIKKVETWRAHSTETYNEMKHILELINDIIDWKFNNDTK